MSFVLITADFPAARTEEMGEICKRLENAGWEKRHDHGRPMNTAWMFSYAPGLLESEAIKIAQVSFMACCSPYCPPILIMQWDNNMPTHPDTD